MYDRDNDSREHNAAPLIVRFRLTATLLPGAQAAARLLYYSQNQSDFTVLDADNMSIYVHATYFRAFGAVDEDGWAMWHTDSRRWEVISMEGCLLRHGTVTEGGGIAESASGTVALYWNDAGTESTLGIAITAHNIGAALDNGDKVQVWYEPYGEKWYICQGTGSGGAIVSVASATRNETTCLWAGNVQSITGTPTGYCTDQFTEGEDCWLLVMDFEGGSAAGIKATLPVGELYFGHLVATLEGVPVYAIRIASQIFHDTADSNITVDGFASQTLPDGRSVSVYNWGSELISAGDKISIYHDKMNDVWYAIKPGDSGGKTWHSLAVDDIAAEATGTVTLSTGASVEATNWSLDVDIAADDKIHVYQDPYDGLYYAIKSGGAGGGVELYSGTLSASLSQSSSTASVGTLTAYSDESTISPGTVSNTLHLAGVNGAAVVVAKKMVSGSPTYVLQQIEHISLAVDKNVKVDSATDPTKIQQTKRTVAVMSDGNDDSADTDVIALVSQSLVTNSKVDSATDTTKIQQTKITFRVFPTTNTGADTDVVTLADQVVVDNVKVDNSTTPTKIQQTKKTIKRFPTTNADGDSDVIGIDACP